MNFDDKMKLLNERAELMKALAHPLRLCILNCLRLTGECKVNRLAELTSSPQSTISQHLAKLRAARIVEGTRNGVEIEYKIVNEEVKNIVDILLPELSKCDLD